MLEPSISQENEDWLSIDNRPDLYGWYVKVGGDSHGEDSVTSKKRLWASGVAGNSQKKFLDSCGTLIKRRFRRKHLWMPLRL